MEFARPIGLLLERRRPGERGRRRRRCGSRGARRARSADAETASSKSWALAGSTVKVGRSRRSRRSTSRAAAWAAASPASSSIRREKPTADLSVLEHRVEHVRREPGIAELADHARPAAALAELDQRHAARRRRTPAAAELDLAAALEEELADEEPAALGDEDHPPLTWARGLRALVQHLEGPLTPLVRLGRGVVLRLHLRRDPDAVDRGPIAGQILPDRQVERAAVR